LGSIGVSETLWDISSWLGRVWRDLGLTLLTILVNVLIAQTLKLRLRLTKIGRQLIDLVQQPPEQLAAIFVLDGIQVMIVSHCLRFNSIRVYAESFKLRPLPHPSTQSNWPSGVGQKLTADLNIGLHANQPHADSKRWPKTI
jgi:hypothetical protein